MFKKQLENKLNILHQSIPEGNGQLSFDLEFVSNFQVELLGEEFDLELYSCLLSSRRFKPVSEIPSVMFDHRLKQTAW